MSILNAGPGPAAFALLFAIIDPFSGPAAAPAAFVRFIEFVFLAFVLGWLMFLRRRVISQTAVIQKKLETQESLKEAAEAANRAKSAFLAHMSHEIRTPMNAILGYCQLTLLDPSLGADARRNLTILNRSGEHLLDLLNDILVMSKIEAGRAELKLAQFDVARFAEDLRAMFHLRAESKGLCLEVSIEGETARPVLADAGKIRQVLINLLGNALKFTERGSIRLHLSLTRRDSGRLWLAARVEDSGVGIAQAEQSGLFRPFVQTGSGRVTAGGTGLGLAISKEFVELMGGEIGVASEPGRGTTIRFEVPVEACQDASGQLGNEAAVAIDETAPPATGSVLALARALDPGQLSRLPAEVRQQLYAAVLHGDKESLDALVAQADEYDTAAAQILRALADKYDYDTLIHLLEGGMAVTSAMRQ